MQEFPYDRHAIMFALASRKWNGLNSAHTPAIRLFMLIDHTILWAQRPIDSEGNNHEWSMADQKKTPDWIQIKLYKHD